MLNLHPYHSFRLTYRNNISRRSKSGVYANISKFNFCLKLLKNNKLSGVLQRKYKLSKVLQSHYIIPECSRNIDVLQSMSLSPEIFCFSRALQKCINSPEIVPILQRALEDSILSRVATYSLQHSRIHKETPVRCFYHVSKLDLSGPYFERKPVRGMSALMNIQSLGIIHRWSIKQVDMEWMWQEIRLGQHTGRY